MQDLHYNAVHELHDHSRSLRWCPCFKRPEGWLRRFFSADCLSPIFIFLLKLLYPRLQYR